MTLRALSYLPYSAYLESPHWKTVRLRLSAWRAFVASSAGMLIGLSRLTIRTKATSTSERSARACTRAASVIVVMKS